MADTHEFSADDDAVFLALANSAARVGVAGYGLGVILAAVGLLGAVPPVLAGRHLRTGARSLRAVATTAGDDVAHLMAAVDGLQRAFTTLVAMLALDALGLAIVVAVMFPKGG